MPRTLGLLAALLLSLPPPCESAERGENLLARFQQRLDAFFAQRNGLELHRLIPFLSPPEVAALLELRQGELRTSFRQLGTIGEGILVFLHFEKTVQDGQQTLLQSLCEMRWLDARPVAVRRVPIAEAARDFRIAAHQSSLRIEADTGAAEILDEIEIAVVRPTRWIFFFLDPSREVRQVSIEAAAEVFRVANFVALERASPWVAGNRVRVAVRSHFRLTSKKAA
jgi:hypothetical protein